MELISFYVSLHKINNINNRIMRQKIDKELLVHLPNEVKSMNLPPKANEILCNFIVMSDNEGWCYSTVNGLAKELQCSTRSIMSNIKLLENKKLILERVIGKKGVASRFRIKLFNENEYEKDGNAFNENENAFNENVCNSLNNIEMYGNENENAFNGNENVFDGNSFDGNLSIEQVILLKFKELEGLITKYIESKKMGEKIDYGQVKENNIKEKNIKEYNIKQTNNNDTYTNSSNNVQEVNNTDIDNNLNKKEDININKNEDIDLNINKDTDTSTCKYKKRKQNDYEFTVEDENDYNPIVENTKVEGVVSKSDGNTSKSKKFFYSLKDSSITFSSWLEAQEYASKNDLNFDENFKKVEVTD